MEMVTTDTISGRYHSSQYNSYQAKFFFIHAMIFFTFTERKCEVKHQKKKLLYKKDSFLSLREKGVKV